MYFAGWVSRTSSKRDWDEAENVEAWKIEEVVQGEGRARKGKGKRGEGGGKAGGEGWGKGGGVPVVTVVWR